MFVGGSKGVIAKFCFAAVSKVINEHDWTVEEDLLDFQDRNVMFFILNPIACIPIESDNL